MSRRCTFSVKQDGQNGRSARPQLAKGQGVPLRYVEVLNEARTKLTVVFTILPGYSSGVDFRCLISRAR